MQKQNLADYFAFSFTGGSTIYTGVLPIYTDGPRIYFITFVIIFDIEQIHKVIFSSGTIF